MIHSYGPFALLFVLIAWHAIADFALQNDFVAKAKNPETPVPGISWPAVLLAHSLIHAFGVFLFTDMLTLAVIETASHFLIDYEKCRRRITFIQDQLLHVACKVLYVVMYVLYHAL